MPESKDVLQKRKGPVGKREERGRREKRGAGQGTGKREEREIAHTVKGHRIQLTEFPMVKAETI